MADKRTLPGGDNDTSLLKSNSKVPKIAKCTESAIFNPEYLSDDFLLKFKNHYQAGDSHVSEVSGASVQTRPFTHCILPNFLSGEQFLADLQDELLDVTYVEKNNDLYKFHQTDKDLKTIKSPCIKSLCKLMHTEIREWLSDVTGIELDDRVDTFAARYEYTDTLSCHDDELEGRRIAYILYLVPPSWTEADGGALDLYNTDEQGQPKDIVKSIVPSRNTLAFFEVSPVSFHQVAEVLTQDHVRLSVTGWFYGKPFKRPDPYTEAKLQTQPCSSIEEEVFYEWINPIYLSEDIQLEIREKFENESEIELVDFLKKEKYDEVLEVLEHAPITWIQNGPANRRRYCRCEAENLPAVLTQCIKLFQSDAMFLVLSNLTGLKLHELAKCSDSETSDDEDTDPSKSTGCSRKKVAQSHHEVRKWSHGSYTLMHDKDKDTEGTDFALDATLYFGCKDWKVECGGYTSYIAKGEDEELLTVAPKENALALVYRDKDTLRFVKHINHRILDKGGHFFDIASVYYRE